ncbi:MAG: mechanosensitive ion channel family protein [Planctomycetes bacterium]|nr:mechanosensitive ion channel family protein [Planctomycetota bacterium]MCB9886446.1 mechanosensitive ion channel family protein [Planctomycetota bacterium]
MPLWQEIATYVCGWFTLTVLTSLLARSLDHRQHPLRSTVRMVRGLLLPAVLCYLLALRALAWEGDGTPLRIVESLVWLAGLLVVLSLVTNTALMRREGNTFEARYPKLLIDILRLILVLVGTTFVVAGVWDKDPGGMLTALGVSSIVLGLALQNTLDNVMAGIAVLFERPFEIGDWITIGATTGEVVEMNWRSVRVRTRSRDLIVVPNSVIGKETLINLSRPTRVHGENHVLGFSYDDAPNKVKRVLMSVVRSTRGVLPEPAPIVRTKSYAAYSIEYQVRFFIDEYARVLEINDEFMTRVWYAAKRNGLTIPFPTQTSYEFRQEMPKPAVKHRAVDALASVPVFVPLSQEELDRMSGQCERFEFGRGERIVHQGDPGDAMYVVLEGTAIVTIRADNEAEREVARLTRGEFFGEMALLTGEPRSANVTAVDDLSVLLIHKEALHGILAHRPALAQEMAEIVEERRQGLRAVREQQGAPSERRAAAQKGAGELVLRIRRFFGL